MTVNETGLRELADSLPVPVWLTDEQGLVVFANGAAIESSGVPGEALMGGRWLDLVHGDDRDAVVSRWADARRRQSPVTVRFRVRQRDGGFRWVVARGDPRFDAEGRLTGWFGSTLDIHEQVAMAERAGSLASRLEDTLETISDGFLLLDGDGRVLFANEAVARLLGRPRALCLGQPASAILPSSLAAVLDGDPRRVSVFLPDTGLWCEARHDRHGEGAALSLRDVTETRRSQALHAMEARVLAMVLGRESLEQALEAVVLGIEQVLPGTIASLLLLDEDGVHVRSAIAPHLPQAYNRAITGQAIGPAAGSCGTAMHRRATVVVEDIASDPLWKEYRDLALVHGLRACWSTPVLDGGGKVLGSFALYLDHPGLPAQADLAIAARVGHLVAITLQSHRQESALRESEERFRQMDAAIEDVFWMEDIASNRLIYLSPSFEEMLGYPRRQFDESPEDWTSLVHPDDMERILAEVAEAHRTWRLPAEGFRYRMIRADGKVLWVNDRAFLIRDSGGRPWRLTGVIRDITEQLALENQLRQSQRMESIGQLTGGIAHDFNNLLTVIVGNAEALETRLVDDPELLPMVRVLAAAAQRGADLTQRLLAFARRQPLEPRAVAIPGLVYDMRPLLERTLGQHIHIDIRCAEDLWPAMADPSQLESALLNLCLNARDAMAAGGRLTIAADNLRLDHAWESGFGSLAPGSYVRLSVSDTGSGIPAEYLERIFEPFFTTKETGKGTGLGLAMVYGFARQSQGGVGVDSSPGQGTTFRLYLPRARALEQAIEPDRRATREHGPGGERILMVEDDDLVRNFVRGLLEGMGYRVVVAEDGQRALGILQSGEPFDLLFTDVVMPGGLSGPQLAAKAQALRPGLNVLFTSGYTEDAIVHHGRLDPGILLLSKPYRREELAQKVRQALGSSGA